ncbi:MAG: tetratricopeptide repeat protein [Acidobacteriota bacterium]|nr:tetratricopeptide repeat protein [Acidobacteriota bacterium]MDQ3419226.1 tetratricopeptide repeat protein [Acidobacteriota bacterium]
MSVLRISRAAALGALVLSLIAWATPASAQTGQLKGKVVNAQNTPIRDAKITMVAVETNRKYETKSDGQGNWRQIGLPPGLYTVTAEKDKLVQTFDVKLGIETKDVNFSLEPGSGKMSDEAAKKEAERVAALQAAFAEGAALTNADKPDEAITKFNEVLATYPKCAECYSNLGAIYSRKQDWAKAEESYKQAIQIRPDMVDPYNGLANVYNAQKKFAEAQAISAEGAKHGAATAAGGAGNADGLYNQGVIAWNGNDFPKAQELFQAAVKANDKHAEAHFMLGQVYLNTGKLPEAAKEFETYLKIAPTGPNAEKAKTNYEMLKQYIK